jgi:dTDP-4-amino-4,6-dideoxygalactose transaminase
MHGENIGVQVHYVPLHHHQLFQEQYGYQSGDFPKTEQVYEGLVSLPLFTEMDDDDIEDVVRGVKQLARYHE